MYPYRSQGPSNPLAARRELLWNVSQPGDPYDIKKSMIAKIPGDKKIFMGDHLELICLLQAAQIQRLCEFLDDYKLKFRQNERIVLDRHSYEVQIKELTQRLEDQVSKNENTKYVDFIKRQQAEIQELQKTNRDSSDGVKQAYQKSLEMANYLNNQNQGLKRQNDDLKLQLKNSVVRYEALQKGKNKEIEDIKIFYSQSSKDQYENSFNSLKFQFEGEIRKYDLELKRLKDQNENKNSEINDLIAQREDLVRRLTANEGKGDLQRQLYQYENKFVLFGQEIERLNIALRDYTSKLEQSDMKNRELERATERKDYEKKELEGKLRSKQGDVNHLNQIIRRYEIDSKKLGESQNYLIQYEQQIQSLQRDLSNLGAKLKYESQLSKKYKEESEKLNYQLSKSKLLQRQNYELRSQTQQINSYRKKIAESENRSAILKDEIQRLKSVISTKDSDLLRARDIFMENESLKSKTKDFQSSLVSKYEYQISRATKGKDEEILTLRNRLRETEGVSQRYENDFGRKTTVYEQTISSIRSENDELRKKINDIINESNRKLQEASFEIERLGKSFSSLKEEKNQVQMALRQTTHDLDIQRQKNQKYSKQNEDFRLRLTEMEKKYNMIYNDSSSNLRALEQQNDNLRRQMTESKTIITRYEGEMNRLSSNMEQTLSTTGRENEILRKKISDYEAALTQMSQELDRLKTILKNKTQQCKQTASEYELLMKKFNDYEMMVKTKYEGEVSQNYAKYEKTISNLKTEIDEWRKEAEDLESRNRQLHQEFSQLVQNLRRELSHKDSNISSVEGDYKRKISGYQANILNITKLNQELQKQIKELDLYARQKTEESSRFENLLKNSNNELENTKRKLQQVGGDTSRKLSEYELKYNQLSQERDRLIKRVQGYQSSIPTYQNQVKRRFQEYEQKVQYITRQNQEFRRKLQETGDINRRIAEYESKLALMASEMERLQNNLKLLGQENDTIKKQLSQKTNSVNLYEMEVTRKMAMFEQNFETIQKENGDLKRKINQYEQRLGKMSQELQRVNSSLRNKSEDNIRLEQTIKVTYEQSLNQIKRDYEDINLKLRQVQSRNNQANQQIERLNQLIQRKTQEIQRLQSQNRTQANDLQVWRRKCSDIEANFSQMYEVEVKNKIAKYQQNLAELRKDNEEYRIKITGTMQEIERLNNILRLKVDESVQLNNKVSSLSSEIDDYRRKLRQTENVSNQNFTSVKAQRDQLVKRLQDLQSKVRKNDQNYSTTIAEYQNKIRVMNQEMDRLNEALRAKNNELQVIRRQFKEYKETVALEVKGNYGQYETAVSNLNKEIEDLKKKLLQSTSKVKEYQSKLAMTSHEIDRLDNIIKIKVEELASSSREYQDLRRKWQQSSEVSRRIPEYEQKLSVFARENEKYITALRQKTEELNNLTNKFRQTQSELENAKKKINQYEIEFNRKVSSSEQAILQLRRENEEWARRRGEYESKIAFMGQQLERVNNLLKSKNEDFIRISQEFQSYKRTKENEYQDGFKTLNQNYSMVVNEYELAKKHLIEYEQSIRKLHTEFERLQSILTQLKKERDGLIDKNRILSEEINRLNGENRDLEEQTRDIRLRLTDETALQKRISQHLGLMVVLFAEIETLRNRVREKEKEVVEVRKSSLAPHMV